ncbi:MAG: hypothetical protein BRC58_06405 [Cyanobacteria bacterium QS_8_64_29]|nr:MAG: hypothetical protein BRC58_06405 [Cyanobacteria bacterium QS_8_64_29]
MTRPRAAAARFVQRAGRWWLAGGLLLLLVASWGGYRQLASHRRPPEAALVLGGAQAREQFAVRFARRHPQLPVWISSGSPAPYTKRLFGRAGVSPERLHLNYEAVDTVTNFTTLAADLRARGIDSVYLITSEAHMPRALAVGEIVLGRYDIAIRPVRVPSSMAPEPATKTVRDGARALLWVFTGRTGASLAIPDRR